MLAAIMFANYPKLEFSIFVKSMRKGRINIDETERSSTISTDSSEFSGVSTE